MEAKPDLSPEEVIEVIRQTSRRHDPSLTYPNNLYGYGEIDAYAGLLHLLGISRVEGLDVRQPSAVTFSMRGDMLTVTLPNDNGRHVGLKVYSTSGTLLRTVDSVPVDGCVTLSLHDFPRGVYAVQVDGYDASTTGSTLVRK